MACLRTNTPDPASPGDLSISRTKREAVSTGQRTNGSQSSVANDWRTSCSLDGAVDRRASDIEQLINLQRCMRALPVQIQQVRLLRRRELRLLTAKASLRLGYGHTIAREHPNHIGLGLRDHLKHVEQQPARGVVDAAAEAESNTLTYQLVRYATRVRQGASETVESFATTSVSPVRTAASASRGPGRARFVPVRP